MVDANQSSAVPVAQPAAPAALTQPEAGTKRNGKWRMLQRQMDDVEETVGVLCHRCESEVTTAGIPGGVSDDVPHRRDVGNSRESALQGSSREERRQQDPEVPRKPFGWEGERNLRVISVLQSTTGRVRIHISVRDRCARSSQYVQFRRPSRAPHPRPNCVRHSQQSVAEVTSFGIKPDTGVMCAEMQDKRGSRSAGTLRECKFCGRIHGKRSCPAYGKTCDICQGRNHFASVCRTRTRQRADIRGTGAVHQLEAQNTASTDEDGYWIMTIVRDELTVENGIIFRGQRCVVPSSLRREVVEKLHTAHMGIDAHGHWCVPT